MMVQSQNSAATVMREKEVIASKSFQLLYSESKNTSTKQPTQNTNFTAEMNEALQAIVLLSSGELCRCLVEIASVDCVSTVQPSGCLQCGVL